MVARTSMFSNSDRDLFRAFDQNYFSNASERQGLIEYHFLMVGIYRR